MTGCVRVWLSSRACAFSVRYMIGSASPPEWNQRCPVLAELFSWATGRKITIEQAMRCAKRDPGRSWEAIESELAKHGNSRRLGMEITHLLHS